MLGPRFIPESIFYTQSVICTYWLSERILTEVKRKSMRNALVPGRRPRKFPPQIFIEIIALHEKNNWMTVINLLKWSEVLQTEGFPFNSR